MIEPLEARIAPAAVLINAKTATFTDVDSDLVTVKFSNSILTTQNIDLLLQLVPAGLGEQLVRIVPNAVAAPGDDTNITLTAKPQDVNGDGVKDGDGLVNVGEIRAVPLDLGVITIPGDLGAIDAGDDVTSLTDFAVKALNVRSLGALGLATGATDLTSDIRGMLGALKVKGDVKGFVHVVGLGTADTHAHGRIGAITVGGSLLGGDMQGTGSIEATGDIGVVKITGEMRGGSAVNTGSLQSDYGAIKSVTLGGSLAGGTVDFTGQIRSNKDLGPVKIGGAVLQGAGGVSGFIASFTGFEPPTGRIASVTIGGSLTGDIESKTTLGPVKVGRDVTGSIRASERIGAVTIGGNLQGTLLTSRSLGAVKVGGNFDGTLGDGTSSGRPNDAYIRVSAEDATVASITIGGSIIGSNTANDTASILIGDNGSLNRVATVGAITIGGDVVGPTDFKQNANVFIYGGITSIKVGGSILGGATETARFFITGDLGTFTVSGDMRSPDGKPASGSLSAKHIRKVAIGGSIVGTVDPNTTFSEDWMPLVGTEGIGSVSVKGSILGTASDKATFKVGILSGGEGIKSFTVGGSVQHAEIKGGTTATGGTIGRVKVGGDWIASSLAAGVTRTGDYLGDGDDVAAPVSRIASITIGGQIIGSPASSAFASSTDRYGFVARQIGSFKAAGFIARLTTATDPSINLSPITNDVTLREN